MVGVPGKYKGCNTCRARRVRCDNQRPFCLKCSDSGRQCQGYSGCLCDSLHFMLHSPELDDVPDERETIFIIGTIEDKGRCSSHPPRIVRRSRDTPSPNRSIAEEPAEQLSPAIPLRSAWDDVINISRSGKAQQLQIIALQTPLSAISKSFNESSSTSQISLSPYTPEAYRPQFGNEPFWLDSQCLAHIPPVSSQEGMLLYLHEQKPALTYTDPASWHDPVSQQNKIELLGPGQFVAFPAHHFFVRVYRPAAIVAALLERRPTVYGHFEWTTTPWRDHPKTPFDRLLDILAQIPPLLLRVDQLLVLQPFVNRQQLPELLENCLTVRATLEQWHAMVLQTLYDTQSPYWGLPSQNDIKSPFRKTYEFRDQLTSITFLYYWATQILLYSYIGLLNETMFAPIVDMYTEALLYPEFPPHLHVDPAVYGPNKRREIAADICRGLDAALAVSTQPDLLAFPVHVVETLYGGMNAVAQTGDGALELMWLAGFRERMMAKGQSLAEAVMRREFSDVAEW